MQRSFATGFFALFCTAMCYGTLWPITRVAVQQMSPLWFGAIRLSAATLILLIVLAALGRLRRPPRADLPIVLSVGLLMLGAYAVLFNLALRDVEAGRAALIGYLTALFVAPTAAIFFGESLRGGRLVGVISAILGLAVLFNPMGFDWSDGRTLLGNAMLLLATILWSAVILQIRNRRQVTPSIELLPWQLLIGAACIVIAAIVSGETVSVEDFTPALSGLTVVAILFGTIGAIWSMTVAMNHLPAVVTSVGVLGAPVVTLCVSIGLLGEALTWTLGVGLVMILGGIALVSLNPART